MFDKIIGDNRPVGWIVQFWPVLVSSFVFALLATWVCKKIAIKLNIVDRPDNTVKTHKEPVAYLGGIGILVGLLVGIMAGIYIIQDIIPDHSNFREALKWLLAILAGGSIACVVGVIDDVIDIKPKQKIIGQLVAAASLIVAGILPSLSSFTSPFNIIMPEKLEMILGIPVVVIFVVGATNSLNLLDGLDGLCAGVTSIIALSMLIIAWHLGTWGFSDVGDPVRVIVCLAIIGGVFGFLPFNRHPAKIFMGDAGSMLLGFIVAALMILFAERIPRWWMASIVVFGLPILDTATALVRRAMNNKPLFLSDRGHLYDQLMDRGYSLKKTVKTCYYLAAMYAMTGLIMSQIRTRYAFVVYITVFAVSGIVIWNKGFLKMEGIRGAVKRPK